MLRIVLFALHSNWKERVMESILAILETNTWYTNTPMEGISMHLATAMPKNKNTLESNVTNTWNSNAEVASLEMRGMQYQLSSVENKRRIVKLTSRPQ